MKHLLIDYKGNIYNKYGDIITIGSVSYSKIDRYGFELDEVVNKNIFVGKRIISYSNSNKIKVAVTPKVIVPSVIILNKDLSIYDNVCMSYSMKALVSNDGIIWESYSDNNLIYKKQFNINLDSINENNITQDEYFEYKKIKNQLIHRTKESKKIVNNNIKYMAILIDTNRHFKNIYNYRNIEDFSVSFNNYESYIDKTNDSIKIKNISTGTMKNIKINKNVSNTLKDTLMEVNIDAK